MKQKFTFDEIRAQIEGGLIVSCQALPHEPLFGSEIMARMAIAAAAGGAVAIRANTPGDIAAIRAAVDLPIIGLFKAEIPDFPIYITPTFEHAKAVGEAGADVIAIDATDRPHPAGELALFIDRIHREAGRPVLADVSTWEEGVAAIEAGADLVASTMSGYTRSSPRQESPDLDLVAKLARYAKVPVLAEGRYHTPELVRAALERGAHAVVVGGAITRPQEITRRFVNAIR